MIWGANPRLYASKPMPQNVSRIESYYKLPPPSISYFFYTSFNRESVYVRESNILSGKEARTRMKKGHTSGKEPAQVGRGDVFGFELREAW